MSLTDDFIGGMTTGFLVAMALIIIFILGNCSSTKIYDYPEEKKECVVSFGTINECYPKDQTE